MKNNIFTFSDGKLLCWRLGPISAQKQKHYNKDIPSIAGAGTHKPPVSRGMWAFPYPHYDFFFCWHQWEKHLPKKYQYRIDKNGGAEWTEEMWIERDELLKKIRKNFRPSTFYTNEFYSHIFPDGSTDYNNWYFWDSPKTWAKIAKKTMVTIYRTEYDVRKISYTVDHLEIFIP